MSKVRPEEQHGMDLFGQNLFMAAKDEEEGERWEIITERETGGKSVVYSYKGTRFNAEAYANSLKGVLRRVNDVKE